MSILPCVAFNKDAFPTRQLSRRLKQVIQPAKTSQVSCVNFQAQYQAFVRFAVISGAALKAIALNWTCVWNLFTRCGLSP